MVTEHVSGFGLGLRAAHHQGFLRGEADCDWCEVVTENFLAPAGRDLLARVRRDRPVLLHGVGLDVGGTAPLNRAYLAAVRDLARDIEAPLVSDHMSACRVDGHYVHDLLPVPLTEESAAHMAGRAAAVQDCLGRPLLLENPSTYARFAGTQMPEWEFVATVAERAGCGILFDVNNAFVNARNHGFDAAEYVERLPVERVGQVHLAGHTDMGNFLLDSHGAPVCDAVWDLFARAARRLGPGVPTMVEWDEAIPPLPRLLDELAHARRVAAAAWAEAG